VSPTVEGMGVELAYEAAGEGPAVLLVHGIADRAEGWRELAARLAADARVIAYDRRGYGRSGAPEPYERTTVEEQAEDAAALLRALDAAPAVACGRDIGALVCLDLARRHPGAVRAAVVMDPPLYAFSPAATEALSQERILLEEWLRDGGPAGAVERWLSVRGAGPERIAAARQDHRAFFADYAGLATWEVLRRDLRALDLPLVVIASEGAPPHDRQAADALARLAPAAAAGAEAELPALLLELTARR
jgi:pimeloyl-ACP methyl ester carboxylesterase